MKTRVEDHDIIVLIDENLRKIIIDTDGKTDKIRGVGVIDPKSLIGNEYGKKLQIGNKQCWVLQPSVQDKLQGIFRQAQIILPRDAAHILMDCAIEPGQQVLEAATGSGPLTIALASAVASPGGVISYDTRQEFIDHALRNLSQATLSNYRPASSRS